jgi:hypothetical protein
MFRRRAAGRAAARLAGVTACWPVRIRTEDVLKFHGPGLDSGWLSLRGDFIEVTQGPVARRLNRLEFSFLAREAWLRVEPGDFNFGRQWLTITGTCGGRPAFVSVSAGGRGALEELWHALIAAGARREQP